MRVRGVSGMLPGLAAAIGFAVAACEVVAQDCNLPSGAMSEMTVLFDRVNADRIGRGLDPLRMSAPLTIAAQLYACKLAAQGAAASPQQMALRSIDPDIRQSTAALAVSIEWSWLL